MPSPTVTIHEPADLFALIQAAQRSRVPLCHYGVAHGGLGHQRPEKHTAVQLAGEVMEHYERDFTARVHAGATIGAIQKALSAAGQFLPIDADDDLSLGEVIDHNVYGPLRVGYGTMRDLLLGLHYADGLGRDIHVGGRVVKNVAGYDVTKLLVGAMGELGVVYEAFVRTYALPPEVLGVMLEADRAAGVDGFVTPLLTSPAKPVWLHLTEEDGVLRLGLAYYGSSLANTAQFETLKGVFGKTSALKIVAARAMTPAEDAAERAARRAWRRRAKTLVKIIVPPASTGEASEALRQSAWGSRVRIDALPAHGVLWVGGDLQADSTFDQAVTGVARRFEGVRVWHTRPADEDQAIEPIAPLPPDWAMMLAIKKTMDPHGLLNPGRTLVREVVPT
ncbi:MAG: FAD-binding oxidoreductase [Phycisphaeraceae bacterium]|nr:FAD-binding oxidoreductase [Phycisphaeraceae bacterium]